jgi:hypothetical protein
LVWKVANDEKQVCKSRRPYSFGAARCAAFIPSPDPKTPLKTRILMSQMMPKLASLEEAFLCPKIVWLNSGVPARYLQSRTVEPRMKTFLSTRFTFEHIIEFRAIRGAQARLFFATLAQVGAFYPSLRKLDANGWNIYAGVNPRAK